MEEVSLHMCEGWVLHAVVIGSMFLGAVVAWVGLFLGAFWNR